MKWNSLEKEYSAKINILDKKLFTKKINSNLDRSKFIFIIITNKETIKYTKK